MLSERADRVLNYALTKIGDAIADEYMKRNQEIIMAQIQSEKIIEIIVEKIRQSIVIQAEREK
jgi:hypothetical protein